MARQFFVGGNFKLNPVTKEAKVALVKVLNAADIDPTAGKETFDPLSLLANRVCLE